VETVADAVEMIFVWRRRAICGRKIAARIVGKTDGPIDNRIGGRTGRLIDGKIAGRMRAVNSGDSIEPIRWPVSMASKGEIMPVPSRWSGPIVPSASNVRSGLSDLSGHRDRSVRRSWNGREKINSSMVVEQGIDSGVGRFVRRRCLVGLSCLGGLHGHWLRDRVERCHGRDVC
jgi:hypothetical protein